MDTREYEERLRLNREYYEREIKSLDDKVTNLEFKNQQLHYAFKGILGEKLTVRIELSPSITPSLSDHVFAQAISRNAMEMAYAEIEKRLGCRYALQIRNAKLTEHIHRLERQVGIPLTERWMAE